MPCDNTQELPRRNRYEAIAKLVQEIDILKRYLCTSLKFIERYIYVKEALPPEIADWYENHCKHAKEFNQKANEEKIYALYEKRRIHVDAVVRSHEYIQKIDDELKELEK